MPDNKITSTRERLVEFIGKSPDYQVHTEPIYMPELQGWLVRTSITVFKDDNNTRTYQGSSFRKIDETSVFTALETAETVSLGRCLAKMGYGIDSEFASLDEMSGITTITPDVPTVTQIPSKVRKEIITAESDGHDVAVAAKLAANEGDVQTLQAIIEEVQETTSVIPEIVVPDRESIEIGGKPVIKRDLKRKEVKVLWEKIKAAGFTPEAFAKWQEDVGLSYKDHYDLMRYAPNVEIEELYNYLKQQG